MQCNGVQSGAINAMNAINSILINLYKKRSYGQGLKILGTDHTREVTGSNPVSPSVVNGAQAILRIPISFDGAAVTKVEKVSVFVEGFYYEKINTLLV